MLRSTFAPTDFAHENLGKLQREMHTALVADGLFDEEATAMLKTWEKSYFRSGGLRVFYLVPRPWIDRYLPLQISHKAEISRVMVARTELISPQQRNLLSKLAAGPASKPSWQAKLQDSPSVRKFRAGRSDFGDLGVPIPADYQTYLDLGRFRNALVLHEQLRKPTPALAQFIAIYGLERFKPPIVTSGK